MAFVDPPQDHLQQIATVGHALALAGAATPQEDPAYPGMLAVGLLGHLGMTMDTNIKTWGANSREEVVEEINGTYLTAQDGQLRLMNLAEKGVCKLADRYVRLRLGIPVDGGTMQFLPPVTEQMALQADQINQLQHSVQMALQAATQAATTAATAAALSSTSAMATSGQGATTPTQTQNQVAAERTVSVNLVANQVQEAKCRKLTKEEVLAAYGRWEAHYGKGKRPAVDADPTEDQLAVIRHLIETHEVPYVDLSIFGPHGGRMLRKQKCSGLIIDNKGGLKPIEFVGPQNFNMWLSSYNVLANALILLGAVDVGTLDEYRSYHQRFNAKFG